MRLMVGINGWVFVFGRDLASAQIIRMGDGPMAFPSRAEAIAAAARQGLYVDKRGNVAAKGGT